MAVYLTSFVEYRRIERDLPEHEAYSVARWAPDFARQLPVLEPLAANDRNDRPMRLDSYTDPVTGYADELREAYRRRWSRIKPWLDELNPSREIYLLCWCPHSNPTRKQIELHGTFCCHNGLIGKMIRKHRPDIEVMMDKDRQLHLTPTWKP